MRLNKFIAHHAGLSRREADEAIAQGRVRVNQAIAQLGAQVEPSDIVILDGKPITAHDDYSYMLFNKPVGYVCSRRAQGSAPTIYSLLPTEFHHLKTVGRLDKDSSGLILLTDDGDFAHRMTHPRFVKSKTYLVELDHDLAPLHQQMISDFGVDLEDGKSRFIVTKPENSSETGQRTVYTVTMSEGRNRQIRRTFAVLGYTVTRLHRTHFGNYSLYDLGNKKYRSISVR